MHKLPAKKIFTFKFDVRIVYFTLINFLFHYYCYFSIERVNNIDTRQIQTNLQLQWKEIA